MITSCFMAGTLIHTREGLKPIQDIQVGDYVLSLPEDSEGKGEAVYKRVIETFSREEQEIWLVRYCSHSSQIAKRVQKGLIANPFSCHKNLADDFSNSVTDSFLLVTGEHPFWHIGTYAPCRRGLLKSDAEKEKFFAEHGEEKPYPMEPQWRSVKDLIMGDVLLGLEGEELSVIQVQPLFQSQRHGEPVNACKIGPAGEIGESKIGFAGEVMIDLRDAYQPAFWFHSSLYGPPELGQSTSDHRREDYAYQNHVRKWPATQKQSDTLYKKARPHIRKEKVYNFTVEDHHTYFVWSNHRSVWVHNACPPSDLFDIKKLDDGSELVMPKQSNGVEAYGSATDFLKNTPEGQNIGLTADLQAQLDDWGVPRSEQKKYFESQASYLGAIKAINGERLYAYTLKFENFIQTIAGNARSNAKAFGDSLHWIKTEQGWLPSNLLVDSKAGYFGWPTWSIAQYNKLKEAGFTDLDAMEKSFLKDLTPGDKGYEAAFESYTKFRNAYIEAVAQLKTTSLAFAQNPKNVAGYVVPGETDLQFVMNFVINARKDKTLINADGLRWETNDAALLAKLQKQGLDPDNWLLNDKMIFASSKQIDHPFNKGQKATVLDESNAYQIRESYKMVDGEKVLVLTKHKLTPDEFKKLVTPAKDESLQRFELSLIAIDSSARVETLLKSNSIFSRTINMRVKSLEKVFFDNCA